jgi:hypothetical protein
MQKAGLRVLHPMALSLLRFLSPVRIQYPLFAQANHR